MTSREERQLEKERQNSNGSLSHMFLFVAMYLKLKHVESHVALTCSKTVILPNFVSNYGNVIFQNVML